MGDLDFNDAVIAYNYEFLLDGLAEVVTIQASFNVLAAGATLHSGLYLHIPLSRTGYPATVTDQNGDAVAPLSTEADWVIPIAIDTRTLFANPAADFINTEPDEPVQATRLLTLTIQFNQAPAGLDSTAAPFDLFIALAVPDTIAWPNERVPIDSIYPGLRLFAISGGTEGTDWYTSSGDLVPDSYTGSGGVPAPAPIVAPSVTCVAAYTDPTGECFDNGEVLIGFLNMNDACFHSRTPEVTVGWLSQDQLYCTTTSVCNAAFARWVDTVYGAHSTMVPLHPQSWNPATGQPLCDPDFPSMGCCENIPSIDEACQVDPSGACMTVPSPSGSGGMCKGPLGFSPAHN